MQADVCLPPQDAVQRLGHYLGSGSPIGAALAARSAIAGSTAALKGRYDPCIDGEVEEYVNRADVQTALHANVSGSLPGRWSDCSTVVQYNMCDSTKHQRIASMDGAPIRSINLQCTVYI